MESKVKNGSKIVININDNVLRNSVKYYNFNKLMTTVNSMNRKNNDCLDWNEISMQMKINTNQPFDDRQCQTLMNDLVSNYVKVMTFSDSYRTACRLWPLFPDVHVFEFEPFVAEDTYNRINEVQITSWSDVCRMKPFLEFISIHINRNQMNSKIFNFCQNQHKVNLIRSLTREEKLKLRSTLVTTIADLMSGPNLDWGAVSKTMHSKGLQIHSMSSTFKAFSQTLSQTSSSFLNELDARRISREELPSFLLSCIP